MRHAVSEITDQAVGHRDEGEVSAAYSQHRPDLVLMDIRLPRMHELRAARALEISFPESRIFTVTDLDDEET
jgi:DNA-binding NarL/FixJ family response regulator